MRNLWIAAATVALIVSGSLVWKADAGTWGGAAGLLPAVQNFTPIVKTACGGPGPHCRWGRHWVCGRWGRCWCAPC